MFEQKKINLETLGEYLKEARQSLNLAIVEVSEKTGIKARFLELLEEGRLLSLPPDVYVLGFLKELARLYAADPEALISQYKKERGIQEQISRQEKQSVSLKKKLEKGIIITPATVSIFSGLLFVAVSIIYVVWQVASINRAPSLEIFEPRDRQVINGSLVSVKGKTEPGISVTVNDQSVFVDSEGRFEAQLGLTAGPKDLVIAAKNKFEKITSKRVSVIGESGVLGQEGAIYLKLELTSGATVKYSIDEGELQTASFSAGDSKLLTGLKKIVVSTSDAGATRVILNGQDLGAMGRSGEQLENIPFFSESAKINTSN